MAKFLMLFGLISASASVVAVPVIFTNAQFASEVLVGVDATITDDSVTVTIPPSSSSNLPAFASASVFDPIDADAAFASAVADSAGGESFLDVETEARLESGSALFADASSLASFAGEFSGAGVYSLMIDFETLVDLLFAGTFAESTSELSVQVSRGIEQILDTTIFSTELFTFDFSVFDASQVLLEVVLLNDALVEEDGGIATVSSAFITLDRQALAVPEPSVGALFLTAFMLLAGVRQFSARP